MIYFTAKIVMIYVGMLFYYRLAVFFIENSVCLLSLASRSNRKTIATQKSQYPNYMRKIIFISF